MLKYGLVLFKNTYILEEIEGVFNLVYRGITVSVRNNLEIRKRFFRVKEMILLVSIFLNPQIMKRIIVRLTKIYS